MKPGEGQAAPGGGVEPRVARRLLITGGAGFIGANFVGYWLDRYPESRLVVLDALTYAGNLDSLAGAGSHEGFRFVRGDIRDHELVETLLVEERLDTIVHLAAESHVDRSISGPDRFFEVNLLGTHSLLKAARSVWLDSKAPVDHRFHHVSTDEVYGDLGPDEPAFRESTPYRPNSPYAASKAAADHAVRAYWKTYGLHATLSNCSNNYGPYQHPEKLIPVAILSLLEGRNIPIYGEGANVRDWIFVTDHCRALESIVASGEVGRTYNVGGDCERTNLELIEQLCDIVDELFGSDPALAGRFPDAWPVQKSRSREAITFVADRPGHDRRYAIDMSRARRELGFQPETALDAGLRETVRWYLDNAAWWR